MSLNQVNSSGELERRAGLVNSEKINEMYEAFPSDASSSNKLVATSAIYKTLTRYWNDVGARFIKLSNAYPTFGLKTNNYIVSCRNGETYLLVCGTTDGGNIVAPLVYLLYDGTGKLVTNGFYYDSTTKEIAFMTQGYNGVSVTQISGEVNDIILSELSETNPLSDPVAITPQKLVTESDINISNVFDETNHTIDVTALEQYGYGTYEFYGQGNEGHGIVRVHIWKVVSGAIAYEWEKMYSTNQPTIWFGGNVTYSVSTISCETSCINKCNMIKKLSI